MSVYSRVPIYKPKRNVFKGLSHNYRNTVNIGEIHLSCRPIECVPGDTFDLSQISTVELQPLIHPFKGDLYYESWAFFVSNRICQYDNVYEPEEPTNEEEFGEILLTTANGDEIDVPIIKNAGPYGGVSTDFVRSYICELGFSTDYQKQEHIEDYKICSYPLRGIDLIYKEYFRDENLQEFTRKSVRAGLINDDDNEYLNDYGIQNYYSGFYLINYKKDRFTGASTSPQKGSAIKLNLTGTIPVKYNTAALVAGQLFKAFNQSNRIDVKAFSAPDDSVFWVDPETISEEHLQDLNDEAYDIIAKHLKIDGADIPAFSIEQLRLANKLQKWQERNQITGTRYKEYLLANYGIAPSDETLQRPALIGHIKTPVIVNSVLQHEETEDTPLGYKAGTGGTVQSSHFGKWLSKEFGWIIILSALRPRSNYQNQIDRSLIKTSVWDFFNKQFESLGQEEIYNCEVESDLSSSDPLGVWGYTDRYNYMREMSDLVTGQFLQDDSAQSLPAYAVVRKFENLPTLSSEFITVHPSEYDYLFSAEHYDLNHAMVSTTNIIKAVRPLSKYAHPSL